MTAMAQLLKEDAVFWMPPDPGVFVGRSVIIESWTPFLTGPARIGDFKMVPIAPGEEHYARLPLDVLRIEDGAIAEIVTFPESVFDDFGMPERL
ncbi:MAG TPA: hypothetical protein VF148_06185 [Acidimicrobiia bacterium]